MVKQGYTELTLDLLQKSPEAGRLLVQLHDKHKLYSLAKQRNPESRAELADIMSDLLNIGLTPPENELVIDVLMTLMRQAEADLKRAVSERIADMVNVPLRLVVHLANESIDIADPVLRFSQDLDDMDLIYIVKSQKEDHWRSISKRDKISDRLIDVLANTRDLDTAIGLTENKGIKLTGHAMTVFGEMAESSDNLAKPLLMRKELPHSLATKLYSFVGSELKKYIKDNFEMANSHEIDSVVDDIVFEMAAVESGEYSPTVKMIVNAENMLEKGFLNATVMVDCLRKGQVTNFVAMFSVYCGLPVEVVTEMLKQKVAQGLAISCKATGIMKPDFVNMFLLTTRMREGRVIDQKDLSKALAYYDKISEEMAQKILNQSRH